MSDSEAACWAVAFVVFVVGVFLIAVCRAAGRSSSYERAGVTVWDAATEKWLQLPPGVQPGPGQLTARQVEEADELELIYLAPAYDPHLAAGCERLWDAIRDERQNGDQL